MRNFLWRLKTAFFLALKYARCGVLFKRVKIVYLFDFITLRKLKARKGECSKCGLCCCGCSFLQANGLCSVYSCRENLNCNINFPVSPYELEMFDEKIGVSGVCSYYWTKEGVKRE